MLNVMLAYRKLITCAFAYEYKQYFNNILSWNKACLPLIHKQVIEQVDL